MEKIKTFNVRLSKETWAFLKTYAIQHERTMNDIIVEFLEKLKKKEKNN